MNPGSRSDLVWDLLECGYLAYDRLPDIKIDKLGPRTTKAEFIGYAENSDARRFLDLETNSIIETQDAEYFEEKFIKDKSIMLHDLLENLSTREN